MSREWARPTVRDLDLYYNPHVSDDVLRMDTSTNVLGGNPASGRVLEAMTFEDLNQYPSTYSDELRGRIASLYGLDTDNVVVGNGSDEILDVIMKTYLREGERLVVPYPSYSLYGFFASINGGETVTVPMTDEFQLDVDAMLSTEGKVLMVCSPNNPSGNLLREEDLLRIVDGWDGPVVVDEAYGEYADGSMIPHVDEHDNLIVIRTFSKAYALAGMRLGYMLTNVEMAQTMLRVKIPYSVNRLSERCGMAALEDQGFLRESIDVVDRNRPKLRDSLEGLGFETFPTDANFMLARCPVPAERVVNGLAERGVLIRDFSTKPGLENCVRMTIGDETSNRRMLDAMAEVVRG